MKLLLAVINCSFNIEKMEGEMDCVWGKIALFLEAVFSMDMSSKVCESSCQSPSIREVGGVVRDMGFGIRQVRAIISPLPPPTHPVV